MVADETGSHKILLLYDCICRAVLTPSLILLHGRAGATELQSNLQVEAGDRSFYLHKARLRSTSSSHFSGPFFFGSLASGN